MATSISDLIIEERLATVIKCAKSLKEKINEKSCEQLFGEIEFIKTLLDEIRDLAL
jgi:hypothetical protein